MHIIQFENVELSIFSKLCFFTGMPWNRAFPMRDSKGDGDGRSLVPESVSRQGPRWPSIRGAPRLG